MNHKHDDILIFNVNISYTKRREAAKKIGIKRKKMGSRGGPVFVKGGPCFFLEIEGGPCFGGALFFEPGMDHCTKALSFLSFRVNNSKS